MNNTYAETALDPPHQSPAAALNAAIENMHDVVNQLNRLRDELTGDDSPKVAGGGTNEVRQAPCMKYVLAEGPISLATKREMCLDTIANLRDILL
jgi:hypothetical protein